MLARPLRYPNISVMAPCCLSDALFNKKVTEMNLNMNNDVVTIKVEKAIRTNANIAGGTISFAKAIELPAKRTTQKFLMPFNPKNPFMWNPEMDFRSNLIYDLPVWPRAESIHVKLDPSVTEFKNEMRIPLRNIVPIKEDGQAFQSNFPKPPLSYVIPEGHEVELVEELPKIDHFKGKLISKAVHQIYKNSEDIMKSLPQIPPSVAVSNKDFMDMRLIVQFPGKLPIFKDEKFPAAEGQTVIEPEKDDKQILFQEDPGIAPKMKYTPEEIMNRRPLSTDRIEKLRTPGFIILMNLTNIPESSKFSTRRTGYSVKAALVEHDEQRYITTKIRRNAGDFVDESIERKTRDATIKLNSLNPMSLGSTIEWFKKEIGEFLPMSNVIFLLLNRSTIDSEAPEKNTQIPMYALLAHYLCEDSVFHERLVASTNQRLDSLICNAQSKISVIQCFIVWYGCLLKETIISPYAFYRALEMIIMKQQRQAAVEIICSALTTAGGYLAARKYSEVATFYRFVADHAHLCSGYVKFLVSELLEQRVSQQQQATPYKFELEKQVEKQETQAFDPAALEEEIEGQYIQTAPGEPFDPVLSPDLPLSGIISMMFKLLKRHFRDIWDFVYYLGVIIERLPFDRTEIRREIQIQHPLYHQHVIEEDNPGLWGLAFIFYAELFNRRLFSFVEIIDFIPLVPKEAPQPRIEMLMRRFLSHAIIKESDVFEAAAKTELLKDERALADAISVVELGSGANAETRTKELDKEAKPSIVSVGLFCRRLLFDMFGSEDTQMRYKDILKRSQKTFETVIQLYPEFCEMVLLYTKEQLEAEEVLIMEFFDYVQELLMDENY
jgi:hypothetical protein